MVTLEETVEALVDLLCGEYLMRSTNEYVRVRAQQLLVADHGRRLSRDGLHPQTGEKPDRYRATIVAAGGKHPQTGETLAAYDASEKQRLAAEQQE